MNNLSKSILLTSFLIPLNALAAPLELDSAAMDGINAGGAIGNLPTITAGMSVSTAQAVGANSTAATVASGGSASARAAGPLLSQTYVVGLNIKVN